MSPENLQEQFERLSLDLKQDMRDTLKMAIEAAVRGVTEVERDRTDRAIHDAVMAHRCDCPLAACDHPHVRHLVGMISDLGDGDKAKGIRTIRENHVWCGKLRGRSEKIGMYATLVVVGLVVSGAIGAFWVGLRAHMGGGQ